MINKNKPISIMLCTAARGGMRTVVESYKKEGMFDKWNTKLIFTHNEGSLVTKIYFFLKAVIYFSYLIFFKKVCFIHNHSAMRGSFWRKNIFSSLARLAKIPVILHLHGSEMQSFYYSQSKKGKTRISNILTKADKVIVLSESWQEFISCIAPNAKIEVIYNYVRLPDYVSNRLENKEIKILFLGLIGKRKGIYDLIESAERLSKQTKHFKIMIGGNGEVEVAKKLVEDKKLTDKIIFLGWLSGDKKLEYLADADIFILPSYNEGLPMSLLEAMSWKLPVISTKVGGIPELVRDGLDGLLFEAGEIDIMTEYMYQLITEKEEREKLGSSARKRVKNMFSNEIIIPQLNAVYELIVRENSQ